jgi:hypothetical protein
MRYVTRWTLDCETGIAEIVMIEVVEIDADRTEQEIRALWSMAAEAPEAKADGQEVETEKPGTLSLCPSRSSRVVHVVCMFEAVYLGCLQSYIKTVN